MERHFESTSAALQLFYLCLAEIECIHKSLFPHCSPSLNYLMFHCSHCLKRSDQYKTGNGVWLHNGLLDKNEKRKRHQLIATLWFFP